MIRFQDALENAIQLAKQHYADLGEQPVLVRDLYSRIRIALRQFRDNLKIVAGMVPEIDRAVYLEGCRQSAYDLFAETLYEETSNDDVFNFDEKAIDAPHYPLKFYWHRAFQEFDPVSNNEVFNENSVLEAYGSFLKEVTSLALGD